MNALEDEVCALLVTSLRLDRDPTAIDCEADLFTGELGLDSVDAVQLITSIENHFDIQLSDKDLALHPLSSVGAIVRVLESRGVRAKRTTQRTV